MAISQAIVGTAAASRYLVQLCKHWSHRFPNTTFTDKRGQVPFAADRICHFEADPEALTVRLEVGEAEMLERLECVVDEHLRRFAFREDLGEITWIRGG